MPFDVIDKRLTDVGKKLPECSKEALKLSRLSFGSFEAVLHAYITPKITKEKLANILLLSPKVDARDKDKKLQRETYSVEKSVLSKIRSGQRGLPREVRKYYSGPEAIELIKLCFYTDIAPRIPESAKIVFLQEILMLIQNDDELSVEEKAYFARLAHEECLGDFLAEVYIRAIRPRHDLRQKEESLPSQNLNSSVTKPGVSQTPPAPILPALGWGDSIKGRPFYTLEEIDAGALDGIFAFNSISDSAIGNEKNFVGVRENTGNAGKNNVWNINEVKVKHNVEYIVRLYVHGSNKYGTDSIASNVKVAFNIPTETGKRIIITGYLFANNAHPNKYWANVAFVSDIPFHLEYVYGSALIENNGIGKNGGRQLSDEIVTKAASNNGTLIGYDQIDGRVPTSYQYASYITIRVKAVFDDPFLIEGKVRIAGSVDWGQSVKVKIGTVVEFYFKYRNISEVTHNRVTVRCTLPPSLRYVLGSTKVYNANFDGASLNDGVTTTGLVVGNYTPGSDVYIHFAAEIIDDNLKDGWNTLAIEAKCGVEQVVRHKLINIIVKK